MKGKEKNFRQVGGEEEEEEIFLDNYSCIN